MKGREYYRHLQNAISSSAFVLDSQVSYTEIDVNECYVRGVLTFANSYELHIAEYVAPLQKGLLHRGAAEGAEKTRRISGEKLRGTPRSPRLRGGRKGFLQ